MPDNLNTPDNSTGNKTVSSKRWASLDHFRGLAVFLMILVNSLAPYNVPPWLKHAPWNGYTFADLVAPMFLFAMGMAYRISLKKRLTRHGTPKTILHFVKRYSILFLFGFGGLFLVSRRFDWGVLQMLGAVGLFSLPLIFARSSISISVSFLLLAFYQAALTFLNMEPLAFSLDMGGPLATLSWSFILIMASAFGSRMQNSTPIRIKLILAAAGTAFTLAGLSLSLVFPLNKHLVTSSYILFSLGLSSLLFLLFYILIDTYHARIGFLEAFGKNPLTLYITGSVLTVIEELIIPETSQILFPLFGTIVILSICVALAEILAVKKIYIKL